MNHCIISNNCYGLNYYKSQSIPYNTPFVGLFIYADCYVKLLEHFDTYMNEELTYCMISKYGKTDYPVGLLQDVEIHFLHYKTFQEALNKWNRRKTRMKPFSSCILKMCDRDEFREEHATRFLNLSNKNKILFVTEKNNNLYKDTKQVVLLPDNDCPTGTTLESRYPVLSIF